MHNGKQQHIHVWLTTLLVLLLLFPLITQFKSIQNIRLQGAAVFDGGSVFDGAATSGLTNISLTVAPSYPLIEILSPLNRTLEINQSVLVSTIITSLVPIAQVSYNIDGGNNITLSGGSGSGSGTYGGLFNVSFGEHNLTVYATTTFSIINSSTVEFNINNSLYFEVNWSRFGGIGTNLSTLNETELQNITNFTLEMPNFGRILFKESINLTDDNITDSPIDLDSFVEINGSIFINDTVLTNLAGKAATLYFYNITYTNPKILRNGESCPASVCSSTTLEGQTLAVDVTGFSQYDVEDGGDSGSGGGSSGSSGAGGGGGSGGSGNSRGTSAGSGQSSSSGSGQFDIIAELINPEIKANEEIQVKVTIINFGSKKEIEAIVVYTIYDHENKEMITKQERKTVENKIEYLKSIKLSKLKPGRYVFEITALYEGQEAKTSSSFTIQEETSNIEFPSTIKKSLLNRDLLGVISLLIVVGITVVYSKFKHKKRKR